MDLKYKHLEIDNFNNEIWAHNFALHVMGMVSKINKETCQLKNYIVYRWVVNNLIKYGIPYTHL